jgi:vitamin B12 transporter
VVSLLTKRFDGKAPYSRVGVAGGSESLTDAELEFGRRFGESWKGYVSGEYLKSDGYRPHADFDIKDFSGDLSYDLGGSQVGVSLWRRDGKAGLPEDTLGLDPVYRMEDRLLLTGAYLRSDQLDLRIYYKDLWHENSDTLENSLGVRTARGLGGHGRKAVRFGRNRLVFGVVGRNISVEAGDSISAEIREGGVTASASLELIPLVWVSPSVSFWHDEIYGSEVSPRMSASMAYNVGLVFFASLARGFNSPTMSELLSPSAGNRELRPEHVLSYSGGVRYETGRLSLELDAFGLKTSDIIEPESDSSETLVNSDSKMDINGVNCRMTAELARIVGGLNLSLATSEHSGRNEDVPYTPEVSGGGYLGLRGVFRNGDLGLSLVLDGEYVGKRLSDRGVPLAAHTVLGGCAEVRIIDARLYGRAENLLDREYESTPGYPAPRRTFIYGFEWDFWN